MTPGCHKITSRQRWTPTPLQLQLLEQIFDQENGSLSKQKIKEITSKLSEHGQISETNVCNWFQNRRARSKMKQQSAPTNNNESEVETETESSNDKRTKPVSTNRKFKCGGSWVLKCSDNEVQMNHENSKRTLLHPRICIESVICLFCPLLSYRNEVVNKEEDGSSWEL